MIINKTTRKNLGEAIIRKNLWQKATGIMFRTKLNKGMIFIFPKEQKMSLHMLFCFFPIDVYFLNKEKKVVEIKKNLRPFTFYNAKNKAKYFIEFSHGVNRANIGDIVTWN